MFIYLSTFISGIQEVVGELIKKEMSGVRIVKMLDGLVLYKINLEPKRIIEMKIFNNSFLVLKKFENISFNSFLESLKNLSIDLNKKEVNKIAKNKTFRLMFSRENQFVGVDKKMLKILEEKIKRASGFALERSNPGVEFWAMYRREKIGFLLLRLTRHMAYEKFLQKGELRPELAYLMCYLADVQTSDIALDPFAGFGSIPSVLSQAFQYKKIIVIDNDQKKIEHIKRQMTQCQMTNKCQIIKFNFLIYEGLEEGSIDKIITDPPWGVYRDIKGEIVEFYQEMLLKFVVLLKIKGLAIVLTAAKRELEEAVKMASKLKIIDKYDILVSGKKAAIYKMLRNK